MIILGFDSCIADAVCMPGENNILKCSGAHFLQVLKSFLARKAITKIYVMSGGHTLYSRYIIWMFSVSDQGKITAQSLLSGVHLSEASEHGFTSFFCTCLLYF